MRWKILNKKCTTCRLNRSIKNKLISNIFGTIGNLPIDFLNYKKFNRLFSSRKYSYEFSNSIELIKDNFDFARFGAYWVKKVLLINNFEEKNLLLKDHVFPKNFGTYILILVRLVLRKHFFIKVRRSIYYSGAD